MVYLSSLSTVVPGLAVSQREVEDFLTANCAGSIQPRSLKLLQKVLRNPSIAKRHFALDRLETALGETADDKIRRFTESAVKLSCEAGREAIAKAGLEARDVTALVVNTCTGYVCPGLSTYVMEGLGLDGGISFHDLVGSGCGGALPNFKVCEALSRSTGGGAALGISVEVCSSAFQMADDPSQLLSDGIFADGAAAGVISCQPVGWEVLDWESINLPEYREDVRFVYREGRLFNQLSRRLPEVAGRAVSGLVDRLLARLGLERSDIRHWALHPGGEAILHALQGGLGLSEAQVAPARSVLLRYGNMSSPTVLFVLRDILDRGVDPRDYLALVTFGAGFSAHACILRGVEGR